MSEPIIYKIFKSLSGLKHITNEYANSVISFIEKAQLSAEEISEIKKISSSFGKSFAAKFYSHLEKHVGESILKGSNDVFNHLERMGLKISPDIKQSIQRSISETVSTKMRQRFAGYTIAERIAGLSTLLSRRMERIRDVAPEGKRFLSSLKKNITYNKPGTIPGGSIYKAASVIHISEISRAYRESSIQTVHELGIRYMKWHLHPRHPKYDICDLLSAKVTTPYGPGVYRVEELPEYPHPQCICIVTPYIPSTQDLQKIHNYPLSVDEEYFFDLSTVDPRAQGWNIETWAGGDAYDWYSLGNTEKRLLKEVSPNTVKYINGLYREGKFNDYARELGLLVRVGIDGEVLYMIPKSEDGLFFLGCSLNSVPIASMWSWFPKNTYDTRMVGWDETDALENAMFASIVNAFNLGNFENIVGSKLLLEPDFGFRIRNAFGVTAVALGLTALAMMSRDAKEELKYVPIDIVQELELIEILGDVDEYTLHNGKLRSGSEIKMLNKLLYKMKAKSKLEEDSKLRGLLKEKYGRYIERLKKALNFDDDASLDDIKKALTKSNYFRYISQNSVEDEVEFLVDGLLMLFDLGRQQMKVIAPEFMSLIDEYLGYTRK